MTSERSMWLVALGGLLLTSACGDGGKDAADGNAAASGTDAECALIVGGHCIKQEVEDVCGLDSGYEGDIMCLKAPPAEEGFQMHIGPKEYTEEGMADYVLPPGEEGIKCAWYRTTNESIETYYSRLVHMRPVSHHLITLVMNAPMPENYDGGWADCGNGRLRVGSLGGSETVQQEYPANGIYAPEFEGVGRALPSRSVIRMELHYINTTDRDLLREMWMNVYYKPAEAVKVWVADINVIGGARVETPPGAHNVTMNTHVMSGPARIVSIFGHYHAHTTRFSVWRKSGDERELVYEDYDWFDPANMNYNSITDNPAPDRELLIPGGHSGILDFEDGDEMYWECEVLNDSDVTLKFSDLALTGEMCNVFGEFTGEGGLVQAGYAGSDMSIEDYRAQGLDRQ